MYKYNYFCAVKDKIMDSRRKISVMGILNVNEDSFFPGSRIRPGDPDQAVLMAGKMIEEGADILDFGACSTRPGSDPVDSETEWKRLAPALKAVRNAFPAIPISVDTFSSSVVERAFDLVGRILVNDISAGEDDPAMLGTVGRLGLPCVAMHKRGTPRTMASLTTYGKVTEEVLAYFRTFAEKAERAGISEWYPDPGFGFAKTVEQNYELLRNLKAFLSLGHPVLIGISRKSMIWKPLGITPEEALPATSALHLEALREGASILRVHDVAEAVRTVGLYRRLYPTESLPESGPGSRAGLSGESV